MHLIRRAVAAFPPVVLLRRRVPGMFTLILGVTTLLSLAYAGPIPKLPGPAAFSKQSSVAGSPAGTLTGEEIDTAIARMQAREDILRKNPLPEGISFVSGIPVGATPDEYQEWLRLTDRIVNLLDRRTMNLRYLKDIRQSVRDLETNRKGWRGFSEKPPYPMTLVDSLQDAIRARKIEHQTYEVQLTITDGELADFASGLRESRTQRRLAEERLEQSLGKPGEERLRWLLALAARNNDLNETGVVSLEIQRQVLQERLAWSRQDLAFLEQKLALALGKVRFTREEFDQKLKRLDSRRAQFKQDLESATRAEESERAEQERARQSLEQYKESSSTSTVTPRLAALRQALELRQVRVETAGLKVLSLKVAFRLLQMERAVWESRYRIANPGSGGTFPDINAVRKDKETLQRWVDYLRSRLEGVENHLRSQQTLISAPDLSDEARSTARVMLAAYQEQKKFLLLSEEQIAETKQLNQRLDEEITARSGQDRRVTRTMEKLLAETLAVAGKIWTAELYVAEETVIIEGQKIVKSRSVTVGKVIAALLILVIGLLAARKMVKPISRLTARKFELSDNDAHVFGRVIFYLLFVFILFFSLITVNIPLAVFAFFGGALAIGVGFGAQTLINNFISGLILLFDRTIRLNDVVEIDGHRGRVTAINIRSSRVKRFDGIEILVPNSHFLQLNVVNLTLSDPFTRYEITVGVAYGTPSRRAEEIIFRAVTAQSEVRSDPAPCVVFEEFADSSLNFRAFFWIDIDPDINSNIVRSEIRHRIADYLAEAGIAVPFPQRDVHLGVSRPLEVTILPRTETGPPTEELHVSQGD